MSEKEFILKGGFGEEVLANSDEHNQSIDKKKAKLELKQEPKKANKFFYSMLLLVVFCGYASYHQEDVKPDALAWL